MMLKSGLYLTMGAVGYKGTEGKTSAGPSDRELKSSPEDSTR